MIPRHGGPEVLEVRELPDPELTPGHVRIDVAACGVNFADTMARTGLYADAPKPPMVVGYEVAGTVAELGAGVEGVAAGDRVVAGTRFGGYASQVVVPMADVIALPERMSFAQAAAIPVNYSTAWAALLGFGSLREGERVLIHAAAGGVGIAATQIAKLKQAGEIYGTASPRKHDAIKGFGVDHPIDYTSQDFAKEVRRISGSKAPLDLVMDAVGGNSFRKGYGLLRAGGRLIAYGASSVTPGDKRDYKAMLKLVATTPVFHPLKMSSESKAVIGLNMLTLWDEFGSLDDYIQPLRQWIDNKEIRPVVAEAFPLDRGADAHRFLQERKNIGKVVLTM
jgi:NADPH:quinone reductase-like Zn-dependent oxidoreductase